MFPIVYRQEGHPPKELWIDIEQLRRQCAQSVDYSLQAMGGFAERYLDDRTLWSCSATTRPLPG